MPGKSAADLAAMAEVLSGVQLTSAGLVVPVQADEYLSLWSKQVSRPNNRELAEYRRLRSDWHFQRAKQTFEKSPVLGHFHADHVLALSGRTRPSSRQEWVALTIRGDVLAQLGKTDMALKDLAAAKVGSGLRGFRREENPFKLWASLLLATGRLDAHSQACSEMLDRINGENRSDAINFARICSANPTAFVDWTRVVDLCKAYKFPPGIIGPILYRAGQFEEAAESFARNSPYGRGLDPTSHHFSPSYFAFKAMTHARLGQPDPAKQSLVHAKMNLDASMDRGARWDEFARWQLPMGEAEELIQGLDSVKVQREGL